jgi:hypothetical protein
MSKQHASYPRENQVVFGYRLSTTRMTHLSRICPLRYPNYYRYRLKNANVEKISEPTPLGPKPGMPNLSPTPRRVPFDLSSPKTSISQLGLPSLQKGFQKDAAHTVESSYSSAKSMTCVYHHSKEYESELKHPQEDFWPASFLPAPSCANWMLRMRRANRSCNVILVRVHY